jgi:hypothetical protein
MKEFQYGYTLNGSDNIHYEYISATSFESALKKAKQHLNEYYGRFYRFTYLSEL